MMDGRLEITSESPDGSLGNSIHGNDGEHEADQLVGDLHRGVGVDVLHENDQQSADESEHDSNESPNDYMFQLPNRESQETQDILPATVPHIVVDVEGQGHHHDTPELHDEGPPSEYRRLEVVCFGRILHVEANNASRFNAQYEGQGHCDREEQSLLLNVVALRVVFHSLAEVVGVCQHSKALEVEGKDLHVVQVPAGFQA
mmetsp:Transcript_23875/g.36548  ORF Transcript_23875/g.36548 Transcript_23875/m.36548 type:complete len:201 (-) Transcript_23875:201-803(-)